MILVESVEAVKERMDVDYRLAEKALRKSKGNVEGAIIWLKIRDEKPLRRVYKWFVKELKQLKRYELRIYKKKKQYINLSLLMVLLICIIVEMYSYRSVRMLIPFIIIIVLSKSTVRIELMDEEKVQQPEETKEKEKVILTAPPKTVIHTENDVEVAMEMKEEKEEISVADYIPIPDEGICDVETDEDNVNEIIIKK